MLTEGGLRPFALEKATEQKGPLLPGKGSEIWGGCRPCAQFRTVFCTASEIEKAPVFSTMLQNVLRITKPSAQAFKGTPKAQKGDAAFSCPEKELRSLLVAAIVSAGPVVLNKNVKEGRNGREPLANENPGSIPE